MKIIFMSLLALLLVSCGEYRLSIGGGNVGDIGEWEVTPSYTGQDRSDSWLINTTTGELRFCTKLYLENGYCSEVTTGLDN